ncbi:MAG: helix-turn-helix protein [Candidatus Accumulibacter vicinus]|uniref:Helix-turn-helix protein n=1 Tax=Candidatus Accumulibacter vicinus TaxID=2954382 RepID=A0A084XW14_9PROT|nr:MAG: helix-turn-helix protein [Candidatus Accumulibacter vicinus]
MSKLRTARLQRGKTLIETATEVGINFSGLSRIERGEQTPSPKVAIRLCAVYGVSLDDIYRPTSPAEDRAA